MKRCINKSVLTIVFVLCAAAAGAQMKTSYFMEGSIPRYDMNAALTPMHNYVNLPLLPLGAFGFNLNNNFLSVDNFIYPHQREHVTFLHESVDAKKFLRRMPSKPSLDMDMSYNLVGFGKYNKNHDYFWSFGWNIRATTDVCFSKDLFRLLKDMRNGSFDISDVSVNAMVYNEFVFGFTMPVGWENLVVGGRFKFIMGGGHAEAKFNNVRLDISADKIQADLGGTLRSSIFGLDFNHLQPNEDGNIALSDIFDFGGFRIGNGFKSYGAAIDVGAEMKFLDDRLKASFALNDLGFVCWGKANSMQADMKQVHFEFEGYDTADGDWDVVKPDKIGEFRKTGTQGYSKRLNTTMNIGVEYTFLDNLLGVGLLSHTKFTTGFTYSELTVSGTVRPTDWFTASLSHSLIHNKIGIFGFAFNFHPRGVNFFLGVDYIPMQLAGMDFLSDNLRLPLRAKSMNVYIGLAFTPGGRSKPW